MLAEDLINCVESQDGHLDKCSMGQKSMAALDTTGLFLEYVDVTPVRYLKYRQKTPDSHKSEVWCVLDSSKCNQFPALIFITIYGISYQNRLCYKQVARM